MTNYAFAWIALVFAFLTGTSLGEYGLSEYESAHNLSASDINALGFESSIDASVPGTGAPWDTATAAGTELAAYTDRAPPASDLGTLMPTSIAMEPATQVYYQGDYLAWNAFRDTFPNSAAGLWIERSAGWSWYATLPVGGWTRELLYVPSPSPITIYEVYPEGFARMYNLGYVQPGYYYIWYYADTPGRHYGIFKIKNSYSNYVVIDVYSMKVPLPMKPMPIKPVISYFQASPASINLGSIAMLSWSVSNARDVTISGIGKVSSAGKISVQPSSTTNYILTASNGGGKVSASAAVTVKKKQNPPVISYFYADKNAITAGESANLYWSVSGAKRVQLNGRGVSSSGRISVRPSFSTTYTLTACNDADCISDSTYIEVGEVAIQPIIIGPYPEEPQPEPQPEPEPQPDIPILM